VTGSSDDGTRRWRQFVRREIRTFVGEHRQPPPFMLYLSHGESPRKLARIPLTIQAGVEDRIDVGLTIRESIRDARCQYAALGACLHDVTPGGAGEIQTTTFGLVIATVDSVEGFATLIEGGSIGVWEPTPDLSWAGDAVRLLSSSLRDVPRCEYCSLVATRRVWPQALERAVEVCRAHAGEWEHVSGRRSEALA
jgi:hypothetical protein